MTPQTPYLLSAFYDWIVDNDLTPYLLVDATQAGVIVPQEYISDGQIVLNVAPHSVGNLQLNITEVMFNARFNGRVQEIYVPMSSVLAIYARENGAGTVFDPTVYVEHEAVDLDAEMADPESDTQEPPPVTKGQPSLRVVK